MAQDGVVITLGGSIQAPVGCHPEAGGKRMARSEEGSDYVDDTQVSKQPGLLEYAQEEDAACPRRLCRGAQLMRCESCGELLNASWATCVRCGTPVPRQPRQSPIRKVLDTIPAWSGPSIGRRGGRSAVLAT